MGKSKDIFTELRSIAEDDHREWPGCGNMYFHPTAIDPLVRSWQAAYKELYGKKLSMPVVVNRILLEHKEQIEKQIEAMQAEIAFRDKL